MIELADIDRAPVGARSMSASSVIFAKSFLFVFNLIQNHYSSAFILLEADSLIIFERFQIT